MRENEGTLRYIEYKGLYDREEREDRMTCSKYNFLKRLAKKKEDSLDYIVDNYVGLVKGTVVKVLGPLGQGGTIEECVNDVFLSIWIHGEQFAGNEEDFKKWVYKIAKYQAIDYYRKLVKDDKMILLDEVAMQTPSIEEQVMMREEQAVLVALINQLEPMDRQIFTMKYFLGASSNDIADRLGLTRTAVDNRVYRGKKKLVQQAEQLRLGEI